VPASAEEVERGGGLEVVDEDAKVAPDALDLLVQIPFDVYF
jgi:hypothetical protein